MDRGRAPRADRGGRRGLKRLGGRGGDIDETYATDRQGDDDRRADGRAAARRLHGVLRPRPADRSAHPRTGEAGRAGSVAGDPARAPAHPCRLRRRLQRCTARGRARPDRAAPWWRRRSARTCIQGHRPQLAIGQCLRAAQRAALRHPRPDRARQRFLRACLRAGA